jgi:hypothetical protein
MYASTSNQRIGPCFKGNMTYIYIIRYTSKLCINTVYTLFAYRPFFIIQKLDERNGDTIFLRSKYKALGQYSKQHYPSSQVTHIEILWV